MSEQHKGYDPENPNSGHGWVHKRPDGAKARCGGAAICQVCKADLDGLTGGAKYERQSIEQLDRAEFKAVPGHPNLFYRSRGGEAYGRAMVPFKGDNYLLELRGPISELPALLARLLPDEVPTDAKAAGGNT